MANNRAATTLLLIVSLFVAVTIPGADARTTIHPNKMAAPPPDVHGEGDTSEFTTLPKESQQPCDNCEKKTPEPPCDNCEKNKPKPEPPCQQCERKPEPELTCMKAHGVKKGETCCSIWEGVGLTEDKFFSFNPNLSCEKLFVGQWVCLEACHG